MQIDRETERESYMYCAYCKYIEISYNQRERESDRDIQIDRERESYVYCLYCKYIEISYNQREGDI